MSKRLAFYIEDQDHLNLIQEIYEEILKQPKGISYQDLKSKIPSLNLNQISHYCRKLYNYSFIDIQNQSHYKLVIARKYLTQKREPQSPVKVSAPLEINYYNEFQFIPNLVMNLSGSGIHLQEIMAKMDKLEENKSFPRLFESLKDSITQSADRMGKIFTYKYSAKKFIQKWPYANYTTQAVRNTKLIELNQDCCKELSELLKCPSNNDSIIQKLNGLSDESKTKRKTQLSRSKMNRYALICNYIQENKVVTIKSLKSNITAIEKDENVGVIDNRTIHNYLLSLQTIGFCMIQSITAIVVQKECQRMLIRHFKISEEDKEFVNGKLQLTQIKREQDIKFEEDDQISESIPKKKVKVLSKKMRSFVQPKLESVFHSEDEVISMKMSQRNAMILKNCLLKLETSFAKSNYKYFIQAITPVKPKFDKEVLNEVFKNSTPNQCLLRLLSFEKSITHEEESNTVFQDLQEDFVSNHNYEKQALKQNLEHVKHYLLRYPNISVAKLQITFPFINADMIVKKLLLDKTITLKDGLLKLNENYLKYYL